MDTIVERSIVVSLHSSTDIDMAIYLCEKSCEESSFTCGSFFKDYRYKSLWWGIFLENKMIGAMQITPPSQPFPIYQESGWPEISEDQDLDNGCEFSFICIDRQYRGEKELFAKAFVQFYWFMKLNNLNYIFAVLSRPAARLYRGMGQRFNRCGDLKLYWNDPAYPAKLSVSQLEEDLKRQRPDMWKMVQHYTPSHYYK